MAELPASPRPARRPLHIFLLAVASTVCVIGAINVAVDPYGYFGSPSMQGLNQRKPLAFQHDRYLKAGLVDRSDPDCLLAGSSRVGEGLDPDDPALAPCRSTLDVSLAGPNVDEMTAIAESALRRGRVRRVVLSLDFFAFNPSREPTRGGRYVYSLGWADRASTMLSASLDSGVLMDSLFTLVRQEDEPFYGPSGTVNQNLLKHVESLRSTRATFARGLQGYIFHILPPPQHAYPAISPDAEPLRRLQAFLAEQHQRGVEVILFFSPTHAWHWEMIDVLGLWSTWEAWREAVAAVNAQAARTASRPPFPIWDFATYELPSAEPVPADAALLRPLPSFWDNSHFRRSLGSRLLSRMLVKDSPETLGEAVEPGSLPQRHARIREERERWRAQFPADRQEVIDVVRCFAPPAVRARIHLARGEPGTCGRLTRLTR